MNHNEATFSGIYAESYDQLYLSLDPSIELKQAVSFCEASPKKSTTVIDVGGGTGRFSDLLCQNYHHVYLVEPSAAMTSIATSKLARYENLTITNDTAQDFKIDGKADGAFLMFSVASYFSSPVLFQKAIKNIMSNLSPGSFLYFDVWESNKSISKGFDSTVRQFTQGEVEYERLAKIDRDSIVEMEKGFHNLNMTITFRNIQNGHIYQENHELALISKKWISDFCAKNQQIKKLRIRSNPNKRNNLEVCILIG